MQAEREAKAAAARAEREANEAKELRELAKAEKERYGVIVLDWALQFGVGLRLFFLLFCSAREERGLREEVEKEALSLEMQAIQAQKEAEQALDEKARLEARAGVPSDILRTVWACCVLLALLSSQMDEARLASAQSKGEAQLAKEQLALEAEHALREAAQDERRRVKMEAGTNHALTLARTHVLVNVLLRLLQRICGPLVVQKHWRWKRRPRASTPSSSKTPRRWRSDWRRQRPNWRPSGEREKSWKRWKTKKNEQNSTT